MAMAVSGANFTALPDELYNPILSCLPGSDLKSLRLTCKKLSSLSESFLFQHIVLVTAKGCLTRFKSFLSTSHLAQFVGKIIYDERWIPIVEGLSRVPSRTAAESLELSTVRSDFIEKASDVDQEVQLLQDICDVLPKLKFIEVYEDRSGAFLFSSGMPMQTPNYLRRTLPFVWSGKSAERLVFDGIYVSETRRSAAISVVKVLSTQSLAVSELSIHGIAAEDLITSAADQVSNTITSASSRGTELWKLKLLCIVVDLPKSSAGFAQGLAQLIGTAPNIMTLKLAPNEDIYGMNVRCNKAMIRSSEFWSRICDRYSSFCVMTHLRGIGQTFSVLEHVQLQEICCYQKDLDEVLFRLTPSLKRLELQGVYLLRPGSSHDCVIKMLERFRNLKLETFSIHGVLSNSGNQHLLLGVWRPEVGHFINDLCKTIGLWITGYTTETPSVLKRIAIQDSQDDLMLPTKEEADFDGDGLWKILDKDSVYSGR